MLKFALSQLKALPFDFETEVKKYIAALEEHRHAEGEPAPSAPHPWVEAVVQRVQYPVEAEKTDDFVPAYEIVDDTPPPPNLEERKTALAKQATETATGALNFITPPLKRSLWQFQHSDAMQVVSSLVVKLGEKSISQTEYEMLVQPHRIEVAKHADREVKTQAIHRHLAQLHSDIHELNETTIDSWKPAPFPT